LWVMSLAKISPVRGNMGRFRFKGLRTHQVPLWRGAAEASMFSQKGHMLHRSDSADRKTKLSRIQGEARGPRNAGFSMGGP